MKIHFPILSNLRLCVVRNQGPQIWIYFYLYVLGTRCQDLIATYNCVQMEIVPSAVKSGDESEVQAWVFALLGLGTILGCILWLLVYIKFSGGSLRDKKPFPRKKNLKKLKKGINWEQYEKSKQAERLAKINLLNKRWLIPNEEFQIRSTLDAGEFASVHAGLWTPSGGRQIALKRARDPENLLVVEELQNEFEILAELTGHQNVIELLGITQIEGNLNIVFPLYHRGNLQTVLLELRDSGHPDEDLEAESRQNLAHIQVKHYSFGCLSNYYMKSYYGVGPTKEVHVI